MVVPIPIRLLGSSFDSLVLPRPLAEADGYKDTAGDGSQDVELF